MLVLIAFFFSFLTGFAGPLITHVNRNFQDNTISWTEQHDGGLSVHRSCRVDLNAPAAIGELSDSEKQDVPEAFYQRHLTLLRSHAVSESRIRLDQLGRLKVWDAGLSSEGGTVLFQRDQNGDVAAIRITAAPNSPSLFIWSKIKIAEIERLIATRYLQGGAAVVSDDGFYDRQMKRNIDDRIIE